MKTLSAVVAAVLVGTGALVACSSGGDAAAQRVYSKCYKSKSAVHVLHVNGSTVSVDIDGKVAQALAGPAPTVEDLAAGEDTDSLVGMFAVLGRMNCLVEATNYPGVTGQLTDGEKWDGWQYAESKGAGSSSSMRFTSTK